MEHKSVVLVPVFQFISFINLASFCVSVMCQLCQALLVIGHIVVNKAAPALRNLQSPRKNRQIVKIHYGKYYSRLNVEC